MIRHKSKNNKGLWRTYPYIRDISSGLNILATLAPREWSSATTLCKSYKSLVRKLITNHGPVEAAKRLKNYQNFVTRRALELPVEPLEWTRVDKTGWPIILKPFKNYCTSQDPMKKHFVISVFRSLDLFKGHTSKNIETIVAPFTGCQTALDEFTTYCKTWGKNLKERHERSNRSWRFREENNSIKAKATSGPNGSSSTLSLVLDAVKLSDSHEVCESILMLAKLTCSSDLHKWMKKTIEEAGRLSKLSSKWKPHKELSLGRIGFVPDKGLKTRVVAIGDGFSAAALQPVHDYLITMLKVMPTSAAFKQDKAWATLIYRTLHGLFCGSSDATAFTDRFPIGPQAAVLESVTDAKLAIHWLSVIQRQFKVPGPCNDTIKYQVGQPMGFLSSWPLATITHHALVEYAADRVLTERASKSFKRSGYFILGDDIVIFNELVYNEYIILCIKLGLDLNKNKSTVSTHCCEFAKQLFWRGSRVSAITPLSLLKVSYDPLSVLSLLQELSHLGYSSIPAINLLNLFPKKYWKQLIPFLSNPETFNYNCNLIDWSEAPKGLSPSQYGWVWTQKQFSEALSYASLLIIEREVKKLRYSDKSNRNLVTNKLWYNIQELQLSDPKIEPAYTRAFYDTLQNFGKELAKLRFGETLHYEYAQFIKHARSLDPNIHIGKDKRTAVNELNVLIQAINQLRNPDKSLDISKFDNFEVQMYQNIIDAIAGSRLWA